MQLQIQTLQKDSHQTHLQNKSSYQVSLDSAFPSSKVYEPSLPLLTQLRQTQLNAKADFHYLNNLRTKAFKIMYEEDYESQLSLIQKGLLSFKFCLLERKKQKTKEQKFIQNLTRNYQSLRFNKQKVKKADDYYQSKLLRTVIQQLYSFIRIKKKSDILEINLTKNKGIDFVMHLKQNMKRQKNRKSQQEKQELEINKIFVRKTLKKYFTSFKLFVKVKNLEQTIKTKAFKKFTLKVSYSRKQNLLKIQKFEQKQSKKSIRKIFGILKQHKLQSQCYDWYCCRLQKVYFIKWVNLINILKNQKQIDAYNEVIVQHFIDSKAQEKRNKIQNKYFSLWKSLLVFNRQQKKQSQIIKSFALLKEKQYLERKYFQILKDNKNFEKANRFFKRKFKSKTFDGLKKNVIKQSEKLQNFYKFIQKRSIKKYFDRIRLFNQKENDKINLHKLQVTWSKFTFNITMEYFMKIQKAKNYYGTLLKFKSLIGLKQLVEFNKKAQHCEQIINLKMPIKRWILRYKLNKFTDEKQIQTLKRIVFQWKLLTLRKSLTSQKQMRYSQLFVQSRIAQKKRSNQNISQSSIFSKCKKELSLVSKKQPSFFMGLQQSQSQEDDDQVQKKVDALLTKIKNKKKSNVKELQSAQSQLFTNQKLNFANKSFNKNHTHETGQRIRVPTWNSPETAYKVSVFSQDMEED